jgi:hypothetical protein
MFYSVIPAKLTEQVTSSSKASDLYAGGATFKPRPKHQPLTPFSCLSSVLPVKCPDCHPVIRRLCYLTESLNETNVKYKRAVSGIYMAT